MKEIKNLFFLTVIIFIFSCSENPNDRLLSPLQQMNISAKNLQELVLYDNELKFGGIMFYVSADNQQLDFNYPDTNENKSIKYTWNGKEVYNYDTKQYQTSWCGFGIIVGKDFTQIDKSHNLAAYQFSKLKFKLRGGWLDNNVKFKVIGAKKATESDIDVKTVSTLQLYTSWREYEIDLTNNLDDVNIYIGFVFENTSTSQSKGGEVFIDDIKFVK